MLKCENVDKKIIILIQNYSLKVFKCLTEKLIHSVITLKFNLKY